MIVICKLLYKYRQKTNKEKTMNYTQIKNLVKELKKQGAIALNPLDSTKNQKFY